MGMGASLSQPEDPQRANRGSRADAAEVALAAGSAMVDASRQYPDIGLRDLRGYLGLWWESWWLPGQDSNLGHGIQSPVCYHYTTGHNCMKAGPPARAGH